MCSALHDRAFDASLLFDTLRQYSGHDNAPPVRNMNDNEQNTWSSIGMTAALILNRLRNAKVIEAAKQHAERADQETEPREGDDLPLLGSRRLVRC